MKYAIIDSKGAIMAPVTGFDFSSIAEETRKQYGWYDCGENRYQAEPGVSQAIATDITRCYDTVTVHYPLYGLPLDETGETMEGREIARNNILQAFSDEISAIDGDMAKLEATPDIMDEYIEAFRLVQYPPVPEEEPEQGEE